MLILFPLNAKIF